MNTDTATAFRILLIDRDPSLKKILNRLFFQNSLHAETIDISERESFFNALRDRDFSLVLVDAEGLLGLQLNQMLELTRNRIPDIPVLVLDRTPYQNLNHSEGRIPENPYQWQNQDRETLASLALRNGATDYLYHSQLERLAPIIDRLARERAARLQHEELALKVSRFAESMRENQKLATIGRLSASIAHEINNPLESITNLLYLLSQDKCISPQAHTFVEQAQQELLRVAQISRQTLVFSRESPVPVRVQPKELLESVLTLYARRLAEKQIEVIRQYQSEDSATVFPGEMRQVFSNLISNAIEASSPQTRLYIRVRRARQWTDHNVTGLRITIGDNGAGIPADVQRRLGEPFFTTKGQSGTGLGLWVTQGIVKRYGGNLQWHSNTNPGRHGTVFSVFLPTNLRPSAIAPPPNTASSGRPGVVSTMSRPGDRGGDALRSNFG